jgi:hypothetical protein
LKKSYNKSTKTSRGGVRSTWSRLSTSQMPIMHLILSMSPSLPLTSWSTSWRLKCRISLSISTWSTSHR